VIAADESEPSTVVTPKPVSALYGASPRRRLFIDGGDPLRELTIPRS
jgi:hypothetical protein